MQSSENLFYVILIIIILNFIKDKILDTLNASKFNSELDNELHDIYDEEAYEKSQKYKLKNFKFGLFSSVFSFILTLLFLVLGGFEMVDLWGRSYTESPILSALIFFGLLSIGSTIISIPFSYYKTFVIEEEFGFNKSNRKIFITDLLKSFLMTVLIGGAIIALIVWFYTITNDNFWIYTWGLIALFSVFMNMFYARLIVPIFNKQTPIEEGSLKTKIAAYAESVGFSLKKIFVIDGSKRSTKANAYFSGFGREKRVTLYDTLINDLTEEEIVAVLAHEIGHYKKKHIIFNLITSLVLTGLTLYILSLFISNPNLSYAIGVSTPSFHSALIAFGLLYAPINEFTSLIMNYISRKFEYQADHYAKNTYEAQPLVSALKKLSSNSLSNLTPHPAYVFFHYSHPTLLDRIRHLKK